MPRRRKLAPGARSTSRSPTASSCSTWFQESCPPCHALEPRLEALACRHHEEVEILQVDIDDDRETPQRFAVLCIPTLIGFRDGREVARLDGLIRDEDLERALEEDKEGVMPDSDRSAARDPRPATSEFSRGRPATAGGSGATLQRDGR